MVGSYPAASSSRGPTFGFVCSTIALAIVLLVVVFELELATVLVSEPRPDNATAS